MAAPRNGKNTPPPVIVKKITVVAGGHHGGAWKVAYADFVTAMMAFFLLLWLLGATTEKQRKGIADYFTPTLVKMRQESAGANGLLGGSSITDVDKYPHKAGPDRHQIAHHPARRDRRPQGRQRRDQARPAHEGSARKEARLQQAAAAPQATGATAMTPEGIRLDLVDDADFSMFRLGTTVLTEEAARPAARRRRNAWAGRRPPFDPRPHQFAALAAGRTREQLVALRRARRSHAAGDDAPRHRRGSLRPHRRRRRARTAGRRTIPPIRATGASRSC